MASSHIFFDTLLSLLFSISTDVWCFFIIIVALIFFVISNSITSYKINSQKSIFIYSICKVLREITYKIDERLSLEEIDDLINSYNNFIISSLWGKYREALNVYENEKVETYFNKTNLIDALTNRKLAEATPGILTGLGILGTFIGLGKGLSYIDISTNEAMKGSIENLMSGLKLAFYTSIVGILFSLIWTLADRILLTYRIRVIHEFQQVVKGILNEGKREYIKEIHSLVEMQTSILKTIVTDISTELSKAITSKINQELLPTLFRYNDEMMKATIEPAINNMNTVIENFSNIATQNQIEGISKIVDRFINEMSGTLGGKFQELSSTIDTICNWQLTLKQSLDEFVKLIIETTQNQAQINNNSAEILNTLSSNLKILEEMNNKASDNLDFIIKIQDTLEHQIETYNSQFDKIKEEYQSLIEKIENTDKEISLKISNFSSSISQIGNSIKDAKDSLSYASDAIARSSQDFMQKVKIGLESALSLIDDETAKITKNLSLVLLNISNIMEDINNTIQNLYEGLEKAFSNIDTLANNS